MMLRFGLMALVYKGQNGLDLHRDTKALALALTLYITS